MRKTIHMFDYSGEAYDACQCDKSIEDGDILYIPSEGVVGIADTWPIAVTHSYGKLHTPADDYFQSTQGFKKEEVMEVVKFAKKVGLMINKVFRDAEPWSLPNLMALTVHVSNSDETNDATWFEFLTHNKDLATTPLEEVLHIYLNWALGPDWETSEWAVGFPKN